MFHFCFIFVRNVSLLFHFHQECFILVSFTSGMFHFVSFRQVLNWLCHAERQATLKGLRARLLIVSLDEGTTSLCRRHGLKYLTFYNALPEHAARNLRGLPWAMSQVNPQP
jgi:hypothetical protein